GDRALLRPARGAGPAQAPLHLRADRLDQRPAPQRRRPLEGVAADPLPRHAAEDRAGSGTLREGLIAFLDFFFALRRFRVPVGTQEWLTLMEALDRGLHGSSLDGFYHLARSICVKDVAHFDGFDRAFLAAFEGIEKDGLAFTDELRAWLAN